MIQDSASARIRGGISSQRTDADGQVLGFYVQGTVDGARERAPCPSVEQPVEHAAGCSTESIASLSRVLEASGNSGNRREDERQVLSFGLIR